MPSRRILGTATAAAIGLAVLGFSPVTANAATVTVKAHALSVHTASAAKVSKLTTGTTTDGITPDVTATSTGALTFSYDATGSTDTASTIDSYSFAYGDGDTATNTTGTASHTYATPGTYTVTVTVTDEADNTATVTDSVTTSGSDYTPYGPVRILDTRSGLGATEGKVAANGTLALTIAGAGTSGATIPSDVTAVALNVTVTESTEDGNIVAYPDGETAPGTSNIHYYTDENIANLITVPVTDGKIDLLNSSTGTVDLIADVEGYYTPTDADGYTAIDPGRILDTRSGTGATEAAVAAGGTLKLTVDGATLTENISSAGNTTETLPDTGITAVTLNIIATAGTASGDIIAYADGATKPATSTLNYVTDTNIANSVTVPVTDGKIDFYNSSDGTVELVGDVQGYYTAGSGAAFVPVVPTRLLDTRTITDGALASGYSYQLTDLETTNDITSYSLNVTVTAATVGGNLTIHPASESDNRTSNLNWAAEVTTAGFTQATADSTGIDFYNASAGTLQLIIDEFGYYATA